MKNRTVTIVVPASFEDVFSYLADPQTLPEWAFSFCQSVKPKEGAWEVIMPNGAALAFMVEADRASGCIEMLAGPCLEQMESFPLRVYKTDSGKTAVSFTMFKSARPDMTDANFEQQYRQLVREVEGLMERFGGGEISRGLPEGGKLLAGLVTDKLAETRDFYAQRLGFTVEFDAPFYVHLKRELGGEQIGLMQASPDGGQAEFEAPTRGEGVWLSLEVDDVDATYESLRSEGVEFRESPKDQPWGERTCVLADPNGVLIYLGQANGKLDPSLAQYDKTGGALAGS